MDTTTASTTAPAAAANAGDSTASTAATTATTAPAQQTAPNGQQSPATGKPSDYLNPDLTFKPGWSKAFEVPESWEKKFTSLMPVLKSGVSLERMLGNQNKVAVPGEHATPEEKAEFWNKLGRPEKPEGYELKMPEKIGDKPFPKELWDEGKATKFAAWAHERGFTKDQVQALVEYDAARGLNDTESIAAAQQKAIADATTALKTEWGPNYAKNLELAKKAAEQAGGADLLSHPLANDPVFIKAMAKVGGMIVEDPAAGARGTSHAQTDPKSEIARIKGDKAHPYWQKNHPEHESAVQNMQRLFKLAHPEPAAR